VVSDDDLGALVATEMTRCIQCTRCVRFGDEIAGLQELGGMGRGEHMQIGTYVEHSLKSEISANIIDLCPVGALTSKPYRFTARAWEMTQHAGVAIHDCLGSNIYCHTRRDRLMRVVPKDNENINETWLSDRDRFSYLGLNHHDARAAQPMIKRNGQWDVVDWQTALTFAAKGISRIIEEHGPEQFAALSHPSATVEEFYLLQKLMRALGVNNIDHRLQQTDHCDQSLQPIMPTSSLLVAELEKQENILLFGCNLLREVPLAGVRLQKAHQNHAAVYTINPVEFDARVPYTEAIIASPDAMLMHAVSILAVLAKKSKDVVLPESLQVLLEQDVSDVVTIAIADALSKPHAAIVTGAIFENHPNAAILRSIITWVCTLSGARHLRLTAGANSAGAWLAGALPHRKAGGQELEEPGLSAQEALEAKLKGYLFMGLEPTFDIANPTRARQAMLAAEFVVAISGYRTTSIQECADVILPMALFAETSGTYINVDQTWQTVTGALAPYAEARPAWKILRVLANTLQCVDFEFGSTEEVLKALQDDMIGTNTPKAGCFYPEAWPVAQNGLVRVGEWPLYRSDVTVRHAEALQACAAADKVCVRLHPTTATRLALGETVTVSQGDIEITLPLKCDARVAPDVIWVPNAMPETVDLGHAFAPITVKP